MKVSKQKKKRVNIEKSVKKRYAEGAQQREEALCCPVTYDPKYLKVIPSEIIERDYGCGDPSQYLNEGDTVLDLGSGGGKICYIASQVVGKKGKVIGVDFNPVMLELAKKYQKQVARKIGWDNVEFRWGKIQDLKTDLFRLEKSLKQKSVKDIDGWLEFEAIADEIRLQTPLIEDESVDVIVSNCVLNLVKPEDKKQLFKEMFRVLKRGGRVAISDIVSDEEVPQELQDDPNLWSGCISGAFQEKAFLKAFEEAGFYGIKVEKFDEKPWQVVEGIEFRSMTVRAVKGKEGDCLDRHQAVIYKGPWKHVLDDDGHMLKRGARTAVCDKTFKIYSKAPYEEDFILVEPQKNIPLAKAKPFDCKQDEERDPRQSKGARLRKSAKPSMGGDCC